MARIRVLRVYLCAFLPETVAEKVPKYCADLERRAQKDFLSHLSHPLTSAGPQALDLG